MDHFYVALRSPLVTWVLWALVSTCPVLVIISRVYMWYFVGRRRDSIICPFIKEHYAFPDVVISKGPDVNYSHRQLWSIMNHFICIVNNSQDRLVVV